MKSPSTLDGHVGFWLRFVSNHVSQAFADQLHASGVTVAEWVLLRQLYDHDSATSSALAEATGLTRGAVSKLVDRLLRKKLVSRKYRSDDRRFQDVALTSEGQRLVPSLAAIADRNDEECFAPLSAAERRALLATLKKLVRSHQLKTLPLE